MLPKVLINWAASKPGSVYKICRFFSQGEGGGWVFLGIRSRGVLSCFPNPDTILDQRLLGKRKGVPPPPPPSDFLRQIMNTINY